jgi:hypothetical protein
MRLSGVGAALLVLATASRAQTVINVQHYALGVDVPEPPAFAALNVGPPMHLGSAPKPAAFAVQVSRIGNADVTALAVDVSPYFLLGGGVRTLASYRSMTVRGRLMRVLTKTIVSLGAARSVSDPSATTLAVGIRSTAHDPHDPIASTRLPEDVVAAFAAAGISTPGPEAESLGDHGVDLSHVFAQARRLARGRSGDMQVSLGVGLSGRAAGGSLSRDSIGTSHNNGWIAAQYVFGSRYDLIGTVEFRDLSKETSRFISGLAVRRKGAAGDLQIGLRYDAREKLVHPALLSDARLGDRIGVVMWLDTERAPDTSTRQICFGVLARWFAAADRAPR